jgi:hypothetical protein
MEHTVSIEQFREELQSWKQELSSVKQEIRHFEQHLEQLSAKRLPKDLLAQLEHFQNIFICQKEVIDQLRHDLPDSGNKVENIFNNLRSQQRRESQGAGREEEHAMTDGLEERMHTFRRIYIGIRQDFHQFDAEWM